MLLRTRWIGAASMALCMSLAVLAQVPSEGDTTTPPLPTPGHALIVGPHELVNPANGSVSLTFPVQMPPGRKITVPFNIMYSSNGARFVSNITTGNIGWQTQDQDYSANGWNYTLPKLTFSQQTINPDAPGGGPTCSLFTNYVFTDSSGQPHALGLSYTANTGQRPPEPPPPCTNYFPYSPNSQVETSFTESALCSGQGTDACGGEGPLRSWTPNGRDVHIFDPSGNEWVFDGSHFPYSLTDRNGNQFTFNTGSETDTLGRQVLTISGFDSGTDTISVSGTNGYTVTWGTASHNFSESADNLSVEQNSTCTPNLGTSSSSDPVVTSLATPDGTYQFQYDTTYGLLSKIIYPNGGYIRYVWALTPDAEFGTFESSPTGNWIEQYGAPPECSFNYGVPMITDRYVSSNGSSEQEWQHFAYTVSGSRQTVVTTHDQVAGTSFETIYSYTEWAISPQPNSALQVSTYMPVESSIVYQGTSGAVLRTMNEQWNGMPLVPTDQKTTLDNGLVKDVQTKYNAYLEPTERDEYDYGSGAAGPLLRQTLTTYQGFDDTNQSLSDVLDRTASVVVKDGSGNQVGATDYGYDQSAVVATSGVVQHSGYVGQNARANLTSVSRWLSPGNRYLTTTLTNDDTGQILSSTDPKVNTTSYSYADNYSGGGQPGTTNAYLTQVTPPTTPGCPAGVNCHVEKYAWFYAGGTLASHTDPNGNATGYIYNDPWDRLTQVNFADGGETTYAYTPSTIETKRLITGSRWTDALDTFDGLGRASVSAHTNGNGSWDRVESCYDGVGNVDYATYPFASSSSGGAAACTAPGDSLQHDALGRLTKTTHADNTSSTVAYLGRATETRDEGNGSATVSTISQDDGLGRLAAVCEATTVAGTVPNSTPSDCNPQISGVALDIDTTGFLTAYNHDILGNLTAVEQPGLANRAFTYDSLSRLLTASNPETGADTYTWDDDGNVATKARANGVTTTYAWDALNRMTGRAFTVNGSPDPNDAVTLSYDTDPTGLATYGAYNHMTRVANGSPVALSLNDYDAAGRLEVVDSIVNGTTYHTSTHYDDAGFPTYERLASGRQLYLDDDPALRTSWIGDANYPGGGSYYPYLADRYYEAWGAPSDEDLGNGLHQGWHSDSRMRRTEVDVHPTNNYSVYQLNVQYAYNPDSTVSGLSDALSSGADNLGFSYDPLNRLSQWTTGSGLSCPISLDRFGNMTDASGNGACGLLTGKSANSQNQIAGNVYDPSGQPLSDSSGTSYSWNVEGQLSGFQTSGNPAYTYLYDGLGRRVEKLVNGAVSAVYFRNALGEMATELDGSTFTDSIYAPAEGDRIATLTGNPTGANIHFYHADAISTTRAVTDGNGNVVGACGMLTYAPFGAELAGCTQSAVPFKFTSKRRDPESALDDFGARFYAPSLGRFMTPDPLGGDIYNPQSLNRYAYAWNNPVTFTDPTGMYVCADSTKGHQCTSAADKAFAASLARDLKNSDETARRAAAAYGKANEDNGVTVGFGATPGGTAGVTASGFRANPNGPGLQATASVVFKSGLSGSELDAAVGHEGTHVVNDQAFIASVSPDATKFNASLNLTKYENEYSAYQVTAAILESEGMRLNYGSMLQAAPLGAGVSPAATRASINSILANPSGPYRVTPANQGTVIYPAFTVPH